MVRVGTLILAFATFTACATQKSAPPAPSTDDAAADLPSSTASAADTGPAPYDRGAPVRIGAANFRVSVLDRRAWPESESGAHRLGYLRHGAVVEAYEHPFINDECTDGWYELVQGGFVCGKAVTADLSSPRVRLAPKQADTSSGMPYRYGVNLRDGTPLYRRVLKTDDRKKYEPWLDPPKVEEPPTVDAPKATDAPSTEPTKALAAADEAPSSGIADTTAERSADATEAKAKEADESASAQAKSDELDAGVDASKPKLRELRGRGVLVRKMVRGFSLALDRDFKAAGTRWWRTTYGFAVPYDRIMVQSSRTKYQGAWFGSAADESAEEVDAGSADGSMASGECPDAGSGAPVTTASPEFVNVVGFVLGSGARKFRMAPCAKRMTSSEELPKRSAVLLTGVGVKVGGIAYQQTSDGGYVLAGGLSFAKPSPPADLLPDEKWIDIDLTRQALVAFEGTRPVFAALVSTGRAPKPDETDDFRTRVGTFRIREKHISTTMDGDVASDGPYSIEDVPWVMYYDGSYALHGAFWHDRFGHTRSHGCVNLSPDAARTVFRWSEPHLPEGWHGVEATEQHLGTRVVVHEDRPSKAR